ncbi:hypothetical protein GCM10010428_70060 [Actinosynnema pretiosum subsp. pretiosum]
MCVALSSPAPGCATTRRDSTGLGALAEISSTASIEAATVATPPARSARLPLLIPRTRPDGIPRCHVESLVSGHPLPLGDSSPTPGNARKGAAHRGDEDCPDGQRRSTMATWTKDCSAR